MAEDDQIGPSTPSDPNHPAGPANPANPSPPAWTPPPPTQQVPHYSSPAGAPAPYPPGGYPPAGYPPGPGAPLPGAVPPAPKGSMSGRTLAIVIVVLVLAAGGVIGGVLASKGGRKHHAASSTTAPPAVGPSSSPAATSPAANSSPSSSASATPSTGGGVASLLSIAPFKGCQQAPTIDHYPDATATDEIACTGADVAKESAQAVIYERFASGTDLSTWYTQDVLAKNQISPTTGDCATLKVVTTTAQAQYCEGSFTDDTGTAARQTIVLAPSSVALTIGSNGSVPEGCSGASAYTIMVFTSPSDDVGVGVLACNGKAASAQAFEKEMKNGDFDLND